MQNVTVCLIVLLATAGLAARAAPVGGPSWAEAEHYFAQSGSWGIDSPPFGAGGECLGSGWGGAKGHFVVYQFHLDRGLPGAAFALRYARQPNSPGRFALVLDGEPPGDRITFASTGGWGHRNDREWQYKRVALGDLAAGWHTLRLESLVDEGNTNLDGFLLGSGRFDAPNERAAIEGLPKLQLRRRDRGWLMDTNLRLEDFAPRSADRYYPSEEAAERRSLEIPGLVRWDGTRAVLRVGADEREATVGEGVEDWHVVGATETPRALVLEQRLRHWGLFVYLSKDGPLAEIRKSVGELSGLARPAQKYPPGYLDWVRKSAADVLGDRVLANGEPAYERVVGWLPEVTGYTFLGTRGMQRKLAVDADGTIGYLTGKYGTKRIEEPLFDPGEHFAGGRPTQAKRGLLGHYLPAIDYGFLDETGGGAWEQVAFSLDTGSFVALRGKDGWRTFRLQPLHELPTTQFFEALLTLHRQWRRVAESAVQAELPERRVVDSSLGSLVRSRITYAGNRPKYGLGHYAGDAHDAFPPTTLWTVEAELEWGLFDEARDDLEYYLDNLVKPDGTFNYYGPAVSEYGMMLERVVRFVRYTADRDWLARYHEVTDRICEHLLKLRRESLAREEVAPGTKGLLFGSPEADTRKEVEYYYSGSMWAWRGLVQWGRLLAETDRWKTRGRQLLAEAEALRTDVLQSLTECTIDGDPPFIPPYPGIDTPFESMIQDRLASYTNYRYWLEMLSADFLPGEQAAALVAFRRKRQGECLGMTRFTEHLDDWPYANYARALLTLDRGDHFLLGFYGHLAHHQMRGTFSDYEQVHLHDLAERTYHADYCVPAQLTVPLLARWMLVFEERDQDLLWLCKAVPKRWFRPGQTWSVKNAPTRWGRVSFEVAAEAGRVVVRVTPPDRGVGTIRLRVRPPAGKSVRSATVEGRPGVVEAKRSVVVLRRPKAACEVVVFF